MAIDKKKREMQVARRQQQEFSFEKYTPNDLYLTDDQYDLVKEKNDKIILTLEEMGSKI